MNGVPPRTGRETLKEKKGKKRGERARFVSMHRKKKRGEEKTIPLQNEGRKRASGKQKGIAGGG